MKTPGSITVIVEHYLSTYFLKCCANLYSTGEFTKTVKKFHKNCDYCNINRKQFLNGQSYKITLIKEHWKYAGYSDLHR